jgi:hypothetical protein
MPPRFSGYPVGPFSGRTAPKQRKRRSPPIHTSPTPVPLPSPPPKQPSGVSKRPSRRAGPDSAQSLIRHTRCADLALDRERQVHLTASGLLAAANEASVAAQRASASISALAETVSLPRPKLSGKGKLQEKCPKSSETHTGFDSSQDPVISALDAFIFAYEARLARASATLRVQSDLIEKASTHRREITEKLIASFPDSQNGGFDAFCSLAAL